MHIMFDIFQESISCIEDPRQASKVRHRLDELLWLMFCGILCGAESSDEIEEYGLRKLPLLRRFYPYTYGIASSSTLERMLRLLHPEALRDVLLAVMRVLVPTLAGKVIAIDGKTSRGSKDGRFKGLHHLSAYFAETRLVMAHQATTEKSNEITAIPELLDLLDITGSVVSIDAMGTQRNIPLSFEECGLMMSFQGYIFLYIRGCRPRALRFPRSAGALPSVERKCHS